MIAAVSTSVSGHSQERVAGHDIALKKDRSARITDGNGLGPPEMQCRACICQIQSEMSIIGMPIEIDDTLANAYMLEMQ
jgi:hypothetical protein